MMRGEPGTEVTVTIAREGMEPFELTVVREVIAITSVRSRLLEPGYAYSGLPSSGSTPAKSWKTSCGNCTKSTAS